MVRVHHTGDPVEVLDEQADLPNGLNIVGAGQDSGTVILIHLQLLRQSHGADADKIRVYLIHDVGSVQGRFPGKLPAAHTGHVELVDLDAGGLGLDTRLDLDLLGAALLHELQDVVVAGFQADVEAVQAQFGVPLQPFRTQAVDGVRPGIRGDPLDIGEGGIQILQHLDHLVRGHEDTVAILEEDRLHAALNPVVGGIAGLLLAGRSRITCILDISLEHIHPIFDPVDIFLYIFGRANGEGNVTVKAAESALVPAAAPVDAEQQAVSLAGGTNRAQLKAFICRNLSQGLVLLFIV